MSIRQTCRSSLCVLGFGVSVASPPIFSIKRGNAGGCDLGVLFAGAAADADGADHLSVDHDRHAARRGS